MKLLLTAAIAATVFLLGCGGAQPMPLSPADLATLGPTRSAEALTLASAAHDAARVATALGAAARCPATDDACRARARLEALEGMADAGAALSTAVAAQRALAVPTGPFALGPDDAAVLRRLGFVRGEDGRWCLGQGELGSACTDGPGPGGPAPAPGPSPRPDPPPPQPIAAGR